MNERFKNFSKMNENQMRFLLESANAIPLGDRLGDKRIFLYWTTNRKTSWISSWQLGRCKSMG